MHILFVLSIQNGYAKIESDRGVARIMISVSKPPGALASGKRFFYRQIELPMAAAYRDAAALITSHMLGDEALEGVSAFVERRKPQWHT